MGWVGAWDLDEHGIPQGSEEDGSFEVRRTVDGVPVGGNNGLLEVIVYAPSQGENKCPSLSTVAARSLAFIGANVSLPRLDGTTTPAVQLRVKDGQWIKAGLATLPPGDDIDIYAAVRVMGWQPQNHIPRGISGTDASGVGGDHIVKLKEFRAMEEAPITDGIAPTVLGDILIHTIEPGVLGYWKTSGIR
jgi:hypothetical protein